MFNALPLQPHPLFSRSNVTLPPLVLSRWTIKKIRCMVMDSTIASQLLSTNPWDGGVEDSKSKRWVNTVTPPRKDVLDSFFFAYFHITSEEDHRNRPYWYARKAQACSVTMVHVLSPLANQSGSTAGGILTLFPNSSVPRQIARRRWPRRIDLGE